MLPDVAQYIFAKSIEGKLADLSFYRNEFLFKLCSLFSTSCAYIPHLQKFIEEIALWYGRAAKNGHPEAAQEISLMSISSIDELKIEKFCATTKNYPCANGEYKNFIAQINQFKKDAITPKIIYQIYPYALREVAVSILESDITPIESDDYNKAIFFLIIAIVQEDYSSVKILVEEYCKMLKSNKFMPLIEHLLSFKGDYTLYTEVIDSFIEQFHYAKKGSIKENAKNFLIHEFCILNKYEKEATIFSTFFYDNLYQYIKSTSVEMSIILSQFVSECGDEVSVCLCDHSNQNQLIVMGDNIALDGGSLTLTDT